MSRPSITTMMITWRARPQPSNLRKQTVRQVGLAVQRLRRSKRTRTRRMPAARTGSSLLKMVTFSDAIGFQSRTIRLTTTFSCQMTQTAAILAATRRKMKLIWDRSRQQGQACPSSSRMRERTRAMARSEPPMWSAQWPWGFSKWIESSIT